MSTASAVAVPPTEHQRPAPSRIVALDLFRGATIAAMIVVNDQNSDAAYWPLQHARWNGWTPTDLVFPFFLFIVGVSLYLSFQARLAHGESRSSILRHSGRRSAILFAIGLALNGLATFYLGRWRIPGVLQRIALVFFASALITLCTRTASRVAWIAGLLLGYWLLLRYVPVPGYGLPGRDVPLWHPDGNLTAYLDRRFMLGHLWEPTRDPEGLLSTLPAIATGLFGVLTGQWLCSVRTRRQKAAWMAISGVIAILAGEFCGHWFPINKQLWSSSYVVFTAGCALVLLALCYWLTDVRNLRGAWTRPFLVFGTNAITAYIVAELLGGWLFWRGYSFHLQTLAHSPAAASLLYSLVVLALCFLPVWWMYHKRIFLKI